MKLALVQFIRSEILFETGRKPLVYRTPIKPGTQVTYSGNTYEAVEQETMGWTWRNISGRYPERNKPVLFTWDHPIYQESRFDPLRAPIASVEKDGRQTSTIDVPPELQDPAKAWEYARYTLENKRVPELEHFIAKSPKYAYLYAKNILKDRFWKAEKTIATSIDWSVRYAIDVMKTRWKEIEPGIAPFPVLVNDYCKAFSLTYDPTTKTFK